MIIQALQFIQNACSIHPSGYKEYKQNHTKAIDAIESLIQLLKINQMVLYSSPNIEQYEQYRGARQSFNLSCNKSLCHFIITFTKSCLTTSE